MPSEPKRKLAAIMFTEEDGVLEIEGESGEKTNRI